MNMNVRQNKFVIKFVINITLYTLKSYIQLELQLNQICVNKVRFQEKVNNSHSKVGSIYIRCTNDEDK